MTESATERAGTASEANPEAAGRWRQLAVLATCLVLGMAKIAVVIDAGILFCLYILSASLKVFNDV